MLVPARSFLSFLADQRVEVCTTLVLTSYAHEVFDEMPEPHLSFLSSPSSTSKLHFPQDLSRFGGAPTIQVF